MNISLAAFPSHDNRAMLTHKIDICEAKRSPLVKVQWSQSNDFHVMVGVIPDVQNKDIRAISLSMTSVSQVPPFMATVEKVRLYGNAIVLCVEPYQQFLKIHQKMDSKLKEATLNRYQFHLKGRFDPYMIVGRIKNLRDLNLAHKQDFMNLVEEQLRSFAFLIQQAALLLRLPESSTPAYQTIQLFNLQR